MPGPHPPLSNGNGWGNNFSAERCPEGGVRLLVTDGPASCTVEFTEAKWLELFARMSAATDLAHVTDQLKRLHHGLGV